MLRSVRYMHRLRMQAEGPGGEPAACGGPGALKEKTLGILQC